MRKAKTLLLILLVLLAQFSFLTQFFPISSVKAATISLVKYPTSVNDTMYQDNNTKTWTGTAANYSLLQANTAANKYDDGVRFPSASIPQGVTVTGAQVDLYIYTAAADDPNCVIYGEDASNTATYGGGTTDLRSRTLTDASVSWVATSLGAAWVNLTVTAIVQELVSRIDWQTSSAVSIIFLANSDNTNACRWRTYYHATSYPVFRVNYTAPAPTFSSPSASRVNETVTFSGIWSVTEPTATLSFGILSTNYTTAYVNNTAKTLSGVSATLSDTVTVSMEANLTIAWIMYCNDSLDTWATSATQYYTLSVGGSASVNWLVLGDNGTRTAGANILFYSHWTCTSGLYKYIFSWHNGSMWVNDSAVQFSPWLVTDAWANVTKALPQPHSYIDYKVYVSTVSNVWNASVTDYLTINSTQWFFTTTSVLSYSSFTINTTVSNAYANMSIALTDSKSNLDDCFFSWNTADNDGNWTDWEIVWQDKGATSSGAYVIKQLPSDLHVLFFYRFKANDSSGWTETFTSNSTYTTWGSSRKPSFDYTKTSVNTTRPNEICNFTSYWTTDSTFTQYIFSFNDGYGFDNRSAVAISGSTAWIHVYETLPNSVRLTTRWTIYVFDNSGRCERLNIQLLTVTGSGLAKDYGVPCYPSNAEGYSARLVNQKKTAIYGGRYWAFGWAQNSTPHDYFSYSSSTDGQSWADWQTVIRSYAGPQAYSAYFDVYVNSSGFVHVATSNFYTNNLTIYYRSGQMYANGTIIWTTVSDDGVTIINEEPSWELTSKTYLGFQTYAMDVFVVVDSIGRPIITAVLRVSVTWFNTTLQKEWWFFENCAFRSTQSNGTWITDTAFSIRFNIDFYYYVADAVASSFNQTRIDDSWTIPIVSGNNIYFVSGKQHEQEQTVEQRPLFVQLYNSTSGLLGDRNQLSEFQLSRQGFSTYATVPISTSLLAYSYLTTDGTIRYGECLNGARYGSEVELWHDVGTFGSTWFDDVASPFIVYDSVSNSTCVVANYVHRPYECVLKRKYLTTGAWSAELVLADEQARTMPHVSNLVSGWTTVNGEFATMYCTYESVTAQTHFLLYVLVVNATAFMETPILSQIGITVIASTQYVFHVYCTHTFYLTKTELYWNYTGTNALNGTDTSVYGLLGAWSNYTRTYETGENVTWYVLCYDIYNNIGYMDAETVLARTLTQTTTENLASTSSVNRENSFTPSTTLTLLASSINNLESTIYVLAEQFSLSSLFQSLWERGFISANTLNIYDVFSAQYETELPIEVAKTFLSTLQHLSLISYGKEQAFASTNLIDLATSLLWPKERLFSASTLLTIQSQTLWLKELGFTVTETLHLSTIIDILKEVAQPTIYDFAEILHLDGSMFKLSEPSDVSEEWMMLAFLAGIGLIVVFALATTGFFVSKRREE